MSNPPAASAKPRMSSQMEAVVRLMTGKEERTIADKLADPNRPTWEQYKKDNQDKLNLSGADQKEMEAYRKELDAERDSRLARGKNHDKKKKKKSKRKHDSDSSDNDSSDSEDDRRRRRKHKKSKKRKKKHKRKHDSSDDSDSSDSSSEERRRKKKKRKKSKKNEGTDEEDDRYRLSNFFTGSGDGGSE